MKRAFLLFTAALIVLLACPSTDSVAGADKPYITDPRVLPGPDGPVGVDDADGDDGDADDIAGFKSKWDMDGAGFNTATMGPQAVFVKLWWSWMFWYR